MLTRTQIEQYVSSGREKAEDYRARYGSEALGMARLHCAKSEEGTIYRWYYTGIVEALSLPDPLEEAALDISAKARSQGDNMAADLLREAYIALQSTELSEESRAAGRNRMWMASTRLDSWDSATLRNSIFKTANLAGIKLPSMMF